MSCSLTGAVPDESKEDRQAREQQAWRAWVESRSSFSLLAYGLYGYVVSPLAVLMLFYGLGMGIDQARLKIAWFIVLALLHGWIYLFCEKKLKGVFTELRRRCL